MTIDEAIAHCLEEAGELQKRADSAELIDILDGLDVEACKECAADHRQLAEWLTELKHLKAIITGYDTVDMQKLDMILAMIRTESEDAWTRIEREKELKEAKRLLSLAYPMIAHMKFMGKHYCGACKYWDEETHEKTCPKHCNADDYVVGGTTFEWRYADEAERLLKS